MAGRYRNRQKKKLANELIDAEATVSIIGKRANFVSWVVVDSYGLGERWEAIIQRAGHRVLAIDDFRNRRHSANVLVSDVNVPFGPALNRCFESACELVGSEFALVSPEFAFMGEKHSFVNRPRSLLISYGGSDPSDETTKALQAVRILRGDKQYRGCLGRVDVVIGHANHRVAHVDRIAKRIVDVNVHVAPKNLAPLLRKTDLLLTSGGNSMVEAVTMRKLCAVTLTSDNQTVMVHQLSAKRAIFPLGDHKTVGAVEVAKAVATILFGYERFVTNIEAQRIFDGLGARRISAAIRSISRS